jgi:hypothetical protein
MTVGELRRCLAGFRDDTEVQFAGGLEFYRVADRGGFVPFEFEQTFYRDEGGRMGVDPDDGAPKPDRGE